MKFDMRNVVLAVAMIMAGQSSLLADGILPVNNNVVKRAIDKVSVRPEDLPEAIKSTLSASYSEWKVTSAFLVTKEDNSQYYEVNIKKTDETTTVNFDKYGKKLD